MKNPMSPCRVHCLDEDLLVAEVGDAGAPYWSSPRAAGVALFPALRNHSGFAESPVSRQRAFCGATSLLEPAARRPSRNISFHYSKMVLLMFHDPRSISGCLARGRRQRLEACSGPASFQDRGGLETAGRETGERMHSARRREADGLDSTTSAPPVQAG